MKERRIKAAVPEGERHNDGDGGCATRSRPAWGAKRDRREENEEESHGGLAGGGSRVGPFRRPAGLGGGGMDASLGGHPDGHADPADLYE